MAPSPPQNPSEEPASAPTLLDRLFPVPVAHPDIIRAGWSNRNKLHNFLLVLYHMARVPLPLCAAAVAGVMALSALPHVNLTASVAILWGAALGDLALLVLLPRLGISFGAPQAPLLLYGGGRAALALLVGLLPLGPWLELVTLGAIQGTLTLLSLYGSLVEPFWLEHTRLKVEVEGLGGKLRVLVITDLHMERPTRREAAVLAAARQGAPDAILLVGDMFNLSLVGEPRNIADTRAFLKELSAPAGVYFVRGTEDVDPPEIIHKLLEGLPIHRLERQVETVQRGAARLHLVGIPAGRDHEAREALLRELLPDAPRPVAVLHHLPDLIEVAAELRADLYLAGHCHGGQICMPLLGPFSTGSTLGRRYYRGHYQLSRTWAYVSRGVGLEGLGAPRMRFLARPELVWLELEPRQG